MDLDFTVAVVYTENTHAYISLEILYSQLINKRKWFECPLIEWYISDSQS